MSSETLVHRVLGHLEANPSAEVWRFWDLETGEKQVLTREEAFASASRVASGLADWTTPRTLIVLPLGLDLLGAHLGTFLAGGIPALHAHPSAKISAEKYLEHLRHVAGIMAPDVVLTNAHYAPTVKKAFRGTVIDVATLDALGEGVAWERRRSEDLAIVQHSSGSTGLQKGVALTHGMVLRQCDAYARTLRLDGQDRIASWIPLYHDMGLFTSWLLPLTQGTPVSAMDPFAWVSQPVRFLDLVTEDAGTLAWMPNFAYNLLAGRTRDDQLDAIDLSSMRGFNNCSEPVRAASHDVFLARFASVGLRRDALWTCYAMAENAFAATSAGVPGVPPRVIEVDPEAFARGRAEEYEGGLPLVSCGLPIESCEVEVRDEERVAMGAGRVGEIALRSPFTLKEYFRNPEATDAALDPDGWYHTGDLGFRLGGHLYVTGRKKDLLIVGGRNFYPQDIEALVDACPGAVPGRSVAIGVDDERTGTQKIIVLAETREARDEWMDLEDGIRNAVLEGLDCPLSEVHAVPHMWLLKTTSGKIARAPNLARFREEHARAEPSAAPRRGTGFWASVGWGLLIGLALYVLLVLRPNASWGIYAGF